MIPFLEWAGSLVVGGGDQGGDERGLNQKHWRAAGTFFAAADDNTIKAFPLKTLCRMSEIDIQAKLRASPPSTPREERVFSSKQLRLRARPADNKLPQLLSNYSPLINNLHIFV